MALLVQFLVAYGNVVGRGPYFVAERNRHYTNLYAVLVGNTAKARKGSSWGYVDDVFGAAESLCRPQKGSVRLEVGDSGTLDWPTRLVSGLSSGEGLIYRVRDAMPSLEKRFKDDAGVSDKRLLVFESEFGQVLRVLRRDGNTLSVVLRSAWDGQKVLQTLTKNSPLRATHAHISLIGHITVDELRRHLDTAEALSGFGNRYLWVCVERSKCLPFGGRLKKAQLEPITEALAKAIDFARNVKRLYRSSAADRLWEHEYSMLSNAKPGLFGSIVARAEAQVMRLACIYALLDKRRLIRPEHLHAALAVWSYCEESAGSIFGDSTGDLVADQILQELRREQDGLTRTEMRDLFQRNQSKARISDALRSLEGYGLACHQNETSGGRPVERWFARTTKTTKTMKVSRPDGDGS